MSQGTHSNQDMLRKLRLLMVLQSLDAGPLPPGRSWSPLIDALHGFAAEPALPSATPCLPLPLPDPATPMEQALGVPESCWRHMVRQAMVDDDHRALGEMARSVIAYARLPVYDRYHRSFGVPDPQELIDALKASHQSGEDATGLRNQLRRMSPAKKSALCFDCGNIAHLAARSFGVEAMHALVEAGVDFSARNHEGQTPLDVARASGNDKATSVLEGWPTQLESGRQQQLADCVLPVLEQVCQLPIPTGMLSSAEWCSRLLEGVAASFADAGLPISLASGTFGDQHSPTGLWFSALECAGQCWFMEVAGAPASLLAHQAQSLLAAGEVVGQSYGAESQELSWRRGLPAHNAQTIHAAGLGVVEAYRCANRHLPEVLAEVTTKWMETNTPSPLPRAAPAPRL